MYCLQCWPWCTETKQENKARLYALHDHTLFVNSAGWEKKVKKVLQDGFSSSLLESLDIPLDVALPEAANAAPRLQHAKHSHVETLHGKKLPGGFARTVPMRSCCLKAPTSLGFLAGLLRFPRNISACGRTTGQSVLIPCVNFSPPEVHLSSFQRQVGFSAMLMCS